MTILRYGKNCIVKNNYIHGISGLDITVKEGNSEFFEVDGNVVENNIVTDYALDRRCYYSEFVMAEFDKIKTGK